jgi:hypothetical protein
MDLSGLQVRVVWEVIWVKLGAGCLVFVEWELPLVGARSLIY